MLFNSFIISATNYSPLSDIMLSGNLYNFHTLSLNSLASSSTNIPSIVATKYVIFDNLSQTTGIASFPAINGNFVIKSTIRCVHSFFRTLLNFSFLASTFVLFFICWHISYPSTYLSTFLVTSGY